MKNSLIISILSLFLFYSNAILANDLWKETRDEEKLFQYLFNHKKINPFNRPVKYSNQRINVTLDLSLIQIVSFDEKAQLMKINVWITMNWYDFQCTWSPDEFGGLEEITVSPNTIWKPDIVLFNNADGNYEFDWMPDIVVKFDGKIKWIPPTIYISTCRIDIEYFPFDQQYCDIQMGSWSYDSDELLILNENSSRRFITTDLFKPSGGWELLNSPSQPFIQESAGLNSFLFQTDSDNCKLGNASLVPEKNSVIIHTVVMRRKPLFYVVNLIIPCVLIGFLSVLVFYLQPEAGEKVTLSISIFLALVVFMLLVSKILPASSATIPLISKYLLFTLVMNFIAIILTVVTINLNKRSLKSHGPVNDWIRTLIKLTEEEDDNDQVPMNNEATSIIIEDDFESKSIELSSFSSSHDDEIRSMVIKNQCTNSIDSSSRNKTLYDKDRKELSFIVKSVRKSMRTINFIANHIRENDKKENISNQWKKFATVIERIQLIIFSVVTVLGTFMLLYQNRKIDLESDAQIANM